MLRSVEIELAVKFSPPFANTFPVSRNYKTKMSIKLETLETLEIIKLYSEILIELKERKVIRSKNLVGELGEFLVLEVFNSNNELPNLKLAPPSN